MKKVFSIFLLICLVIFPLYSYLFEGLSLNQLKVVKTEHFDIIFDEGSLKKAYDIYQNGESCYQDISSKLDSTIDLKLPVAVTSRIKDFNGYYTFANLMRIAVFDTFISREFMSAAKNVFYHELTHAISLNQRHPFIQKISNVLGPYVNLSTAVYLTMNFIEGITVFLEDGRLNDSYFSSKLVQAKLDGKFPKTWLATTSARNIYPVGDMYYIYGGSFVKYLSTTYSQQKVAEFYKTAGNFTFGFTGTLFKKVFNISINKAFEDFSKTIEVFDVIKEDRVLATGACIEDLDYANGKLYFADSVLNTLCSFELSTSKLKKERYDSQLMFIDYKNQDKIVSVVDNDIAYLLFNNKKIDGLFIGSSFDSKVVGVNTKGFVFDNKLIRVPQGCKIADLEYIDQNTVVAIIYDDSTSYLTVVDLTTSKIKWIENKEGLIFRDLDYNDCVITVSFSTNTSSLSGYAKLDLTNEVFYKSTVQVNGGIHYPILIGDEVYYATLHYDWSDLCVIKESSLKLVESEIEYFDFQEKNIDFSSFLSLADSYKPFSYFTKGNILPVVSNIAGPGLTYLVEDPAEAFSFSSSLGFEVDFNTLCFSTNFSDQRFKIKISHSLNTYYSFDDKIPYILYVNQLDYKLRLTSQMKIELSFVALSNLWYYDKDFYLMGSFTSKINIADVANLSIEPSYVGEGCFDLDTVFTFKFSRLLPFNNPMNFKLNLPTDLGLSYHLLSNCLSFTTLTNVFSYEVQDGISFLSMYVRDISLDFNYSLDYELGQKQLQAEYGMIAYVHLVPVFGTIGMDFNTKIGLSASYKPNRGLICSFYLKVGDK